MGSTAVIVSEAGGRQSNDAWRIITSLVLDGISSRHTRRAYSQALDEFLIWFRDDPEREFNKAAVQKYRAELEIKGLAPSSINVRLSAIRRLALEAADNGRDGSGTCGGRRSSQRRKTGRSALGPLAYGRTGRTVPGTSGFEDAQGKSRRRRACHSPRRGPAQVGVDEPGLRAPSGARWPLGHRRPGWQNGPDSECTDSVVGARRHHPLERCGWHL